MPGPSPAGAHRLRRGARVPDPRLRKPGAPPGGLDKFFIDIFRVLRFHGLILLKFKLPRLDFGARRSTMPQCPHCQLPFEAGQRYCSTCGSFLLHPEQGDTFCPQCGVRVSPLQEFCHECDAPLKGDLAAPEVLGAASGAAAPAPGSPAGQNPPPPACRPGSWAYWWARGYLSSSC